MWKYRLNILGVSECHLTGLGMSKVGDGVEIL